jgi:hypothetical protein
MVRGQKEFEKGATWREGKKFDNGARTDSEIGKRNFE